MFSHTGNWLGGVGALDMKQKYKQVDKALRCSLGFKSGLWLGHSRTFRVVPRPLLCYLGCVLRVVVLLDDEPSPQSEVQSALEQVFIKDVSGHCCIHLSLDPDWSPSFCSWKTSPQHDAATTMLHCRDGIGQVMSGAWFPPDMTLGI